MSGCLSHQAASAAVHSWARRHSRLSWQASSTEQYTAPATGADSSPDTTATMASSSSPRPSSTRPARTVARPWTLSASATRSASPVRRPMAAARAAVRPAAA